MVSLALGVAANLITNATIGLAKRIGLASSKPVSRFALWRHNKAQEVASEASSLTNEPVTLIEVMMLRYTVYFASLCISLLFVALLGRSEGFASYGVGLWVGRVIVSVSHALALFLGWRLDLIRDARKILAQHTAGTEPDSGADGGEAVLKESEARQDSKEGLHMPAGFGGWIVAIGLGVVFTGWLLTVKPWEPNREPIGTETTSSSAPALAATATSPIKEATEATGTPDIEAQFNRTKCSDPPGTPCLAQGGTSWDTWAVAVFGQLGRCRWPELASSNRESDGTIPIPLTSATKVFLPVPAPAGSYYPHMWSGNELVRIPACEPGGATPCVITATETASDQPWKAYCEIADQSGQLGYDCSPYLGRVLYFQNRDSQCTWARVNEDLNSAGTTELTVEVAKGSWIVVPSKLTFDILP